MSLRKKTAAEKDHKKRKRDKKKELRIEKRETRKDARMDKKETRKSAREDKKNVRQSDLTGKEKREAKKGIRKGKREVVKDINKGKRDDIKDIKSEIRDVKNSLKIVLPSTSGNVAILRADLADRGLTINQAYAILDRAFDKAKVLSEAGLEHLENIINRDRNAWVDVWNSDTLLVTWFGSITKAKHAKDVFDRMKSVDTRLNKKITIRLHPQRDIKTNAQNMGTFFEPKKFKVFPKLLIKDVDEIAAIMVHELIHIWFMDQKLESGETVYGSPNALALVAENPRKARRSAENFELYCLSFA